MSQNKLDSLSSSVVGSDWRTRWRPYALFGMAILLAAAVWQLIPYGARAFTPQGAEALRLAAVPGIFALQAILALLVDGGLSFTGIPVRWQHRGGLIASLLLGAAGWLYIWLLPSPAAGAGMLLAILAGAFSGSLVATAIQEGLVENNLPPSALVAEEVARFHRARIGIPKRGNLPKRLFDLSLALFGIILSAPLAVLIVFLVWLEDPGPILFIKNSVGKGGENFHQFKFRTMVSDAEGDTGPIPARESDVRVLSIGALLRKTALDELPQLINILRGQMSFVGPRPQRTVLVYTYLRDLPAYAERHLVLPGLAGLAQVAGDYYLTPLQKLRYDRIYARHASLGFDLKLLFLACALVFWYRWKRDWDGRLPRYWLH